jgi:hypothetical protein
MTPKSIPYPQDILTKMWETEHELRILNEKIPGFEVGNKQFFAILTEDSTADLGLSSKEAVGVGLFEDCKYRHLKGDDMDCAIFLSNHYGTFHAKKEQLDYVDQLDFYNIYEVVHKRMSLNLNGTPLNPKDGWFKLSLCRKKPLDKEGVRSCGIADECFPAKTRDRAYLCIPKHWQLDGEAVGVCLKHLDLYLNRKCFGYKIVELTSVSNGDWANETISRTENTLQYQSGYFDLDLAASQARLQVLDCAQKSL